MGDKIELTCVITKLFYGDVAQDEYICFEAFTYGEQSATRPDIFNKLLAIENRRVKITIEELDNALNLR